MENITENINIDSNKTEDSDYHDPFEEAEQCLKIKLPEGLKRIFIFNGYNNKYILSKLEETDILDTETFARELLPDLIEKTEYPQYYGIFKNNIDKFKILTGLKKQILCVSSFYSDQLKQDKSVNIFTKTKKLMPKSSQRSSASTLVMESEPSGECVEPISKRLCIETVNIDLNEEKLFVVKKIKNWILSNVSDMYNNEDIEISIQLVGHHQDTDNTLENTQSIINNNLKAKVYCFLCNLPLYIHKLSSTGHTNKRWVYSNYYKHIKTHILKKENKLKDSKKLGLKNGTLDNFVESNNCIMKSNEHENTNIESDYSSKHFPAEKLLEDNDQDFDDCRVIIEANNTCSINQLPSTSTESFSSKWKSVKYQRSSRSKRQRERSLITDKQKQPVITNFFPIIDGVQKLLNENENLRTLLIENDTYILENSSAKQNVPTIFDTNGLLKCLYESALKNQSVSNKKSQYHNRFDEKVKKFSVYLFIIGGRLLYETLYCNMRNVLPSITTIFRYMDQTQDKIVEGTFRFKELRLFLIQRNLPLQVWISEDGTRITGKIEYEEHSNKLVGFVLPLKNGCPQTDTYIASSAKSIINHFNSGVRANYAYVVMAQSIDDSAPSFCLSILGTDSRFSYEDVMKRWEVMKSLAAQEEIDILGFSSDGDPRLLKAMQVSGFSNISTTEPSNNIDEIDDSVNDKSELDWSWFAIGKPPGENTLNEMYVQDTVHIGTKLRTRFLKPSIILPMGSNFASVSHLVSLTKQYSKDKHLLTMTDLKPEDKMNFRSAEKMCSTNVLELFPSIPDTSATIGFLTIMNYILTAYLDKNLKIEERIYKMWFSVFFLRIWKVWIQNNSEYTLGENFISTNCYSCIEINAHSLIRLVIRFRDDKNLKAELFTIWNFSSQTCEQFFRATRSLTSTYSTVVNFSMKDIINRLKRIEAITTIKTELESSDTGIQFTRQKQKNNINSSNFNGLDNTTIINIVKKSLTDAKHMAHSLGMDIQTDSISMQIPVLKAKIRPKCFLNSNEVENTVDGITGDNITNNENETSESNVDMCDISKAINCGLSLDLKDFSDQFLDDELMPKKVPVKSSCVQVLLNNNNSMVIKKSSLIWLLEQHRARVSNDRLLRFINSRCDQGAQQINKIKCNQTKCLTQSNIEVNEESSEESDIQSESTPPISPYQSDDSNEEDKDTQEIQLKIESYYAIRYDINWYIGRLLNIENDLCKIKFLKSDLDTFVWPRTDEISFIKKKYIFYGPLHLSGTGPFAIKRFDRNKIVQIFKAIKNQL